MSVSRTTMLAFLLLLAAGAGPEAGIDDKKKPVAAAGARGPTLDFPTFGVSLTPPDGWSRGPVGTPGRIVSFGLPADQIDEGAGPATRPPLTRLRSDRIVAMLNVEVSWVDVPTLDEFADRQMDGGVWAVTDARATLGGKPAVRLRATAERGLALRYA